MPSPEPQSQPRQQHQEHQEHPTSCTQQPSASQPTTSTSIKHKFQGPDFVIPKVLCNYLLHEETRTKETFKQAVESKYGRDDNVMLYLRFKPEELVDQKCLEHILLCDSRTRVDDLIQDLITLLHVKTDFYKLELYGGKRYQVQKGDLHLRDIAYKQSNEGAERFTLDLKISPATEELRKLLEGETEELEENKKLECEPVRPDRVQSSSSDSSTQIGNQEVQESFDVAERAETINSIDTRTSTQSDFEAPTTSHSVEADDPNASAHPLSIDDDEMPSLTVEAPGEEVSFEETAPPSPQIPSLSLSHSAPPTSDPSSSAPTPSHSQHQLQLNRQQSLSRSLTQSGQRRNQRSGQNNIVSYHDLPLGAGNFLQLYPNLPSVRVEANVPMDNKLKFIAQYMRLPLEDVQKWSIQEITRVFSTICTEAINKAKQKETLMSKFHELKRRFESTKSLSEKIAITKEIQATEKLIHDIDREEFVRNMTMRKLAPGRQSSHQPPLAKVPKLNEAPQSRHHAQPAQKVRPQQLPTPPAGNRFLVPPNPQLILSNLQQKSRLINMAVAAGRSHEIAQVNPQLMSEISRIASSMPPSQTQRVELAGVRSASEVASKAAPSPCNFRPDEKQKHDNCFVSVASPLHKESMLLWSFKPLEKCEEVHKQNTIKAINEYRVLCHTRQADPSSFLEFYYLGAPYPVVSKMISIADYNMYLSRRRCDMSGVKIDRIDNADQLQLYLLGLQLDEPDDEKWKTFYQIMKWELPKDNAFPKIKRKPKRKRIDDIASTLTPPSVSSAPTRPSNPVLLKHSPTSSEASSISPQVDEPAASPSVSLQSPPS